MNRLGVVVLPSLQPPTAAVAAAADDGAAAVVMKVAIAAISLLVGGIFGLDR
jgi:hypothetical protein